MPIYQKQHPDIRLIPLDHVTYLNCELVYLTIEYSGPCIITVMMVASWYQLVAKCLAKLVLKIAWVVGFILIAKDTNKNRYSCSNLANILICLHYLLDPSLEKTINIIV